LRQSPNSTPIDTNAGGIEIASASNAQRPGAAILITLSTFSNTLPPDSSARCKVNSLGAVLVHDRRTLLAPDMVEAIANGRQLAGLQLDGLMRRFPVG
jgi:hypothetical protein